MENILTIKAWRRPSYYQRVVDALERCPGIEAYTIHTIVDYSDPQTRFQEAHQQIGEKSHLDIHTFLSPRPLGCAGATRACLKAGFEGTTADFVIHLEDDTVPSPDFIRFMEFAAARYRDDPEIFCVHAHNRRTDVDSDFMSEISHISSRRGVTTYWGWGIWRRIWEEMRLDFFGIHWLKGEPDPIPENEEFMKHVAIDDDGSWGWPMLKYWPRGRHEVFPLVSRIQNIGREGGRFCVDEEVYWNRHHTPVVAGEVTLDTYRVV